MSNEGYFISFLIADEAGADNQASSSSISADELPDLE